MKESREIADEITRGPPFDQLTPFEREWALNQIAAAISEDRAQRGSPQATIIVSGSEMFQPTSHGNDRTVCACAECKARIAGGPHRNTPFSIEETAKPFGDGNQ
jgi:hypothetical protein